MNLITISNVSIRQFDNLYNLNDFHRASGGENRHRPSFWLQNQQALDLINELNRENASVGNPTVPVIKVINGGRNRGTFVCKELVYAYATWISAKFFLQVIRTFDSVASGSFKLETAPPVPTPSVPALPNGSVVLSPNDVHRLKIIFNYLPYMMAYYHCTAPAVAHLNDHIIHRTSGRFGDTMMSAGLLAKSLNMPMLSGRDVMHELYS